ncbi:inosine 5-monophosphate dehydrogenase [Mariprofundus micogutta]|uniref:Inosine 5-monophosphate dehydrogenase n=1 Tax=Mariprofundus micogutta TaxID=1921010 RepID=A0A1L8CPV1_9PROT|nr:CBS domain-containing protein [Mariprofundus micogutta]GAV20927.1 inosine 5-monophosphate dehydrogenase [Mariprofundus micogutta]
MLVKNIMVTDAVIAHVDDAVGDVLEKMRSASLRMVPVIDQNRHVVGVISTHTILEKTVPNYIVSGDLNQISYAPDLGILRKQYDVIACEKASEIMDPKPLTVGEEESLLSVAAAMITYTKHEYAVVIDAQHHLLGVVSAGDILDRLKLTEQGGDDA